MDGEPNALRKPLNANVQVSCSRERTCFDSGHAEHSNLSQKHAFANDSKDRRSPAASTAPDTKRQTKSTPDLATLIERFRQFKLPDVRDRSTWVPFQQLSTCIMEQDLIRTTTHILNNALETRATDPKHWSRRARKFLCAYMVFTCPNEIMQETPLSEIKRLRLAAKTLLMDFEAYLSFPDTMSTKLQSSWDMFITLFESWKDKDKEALVKGIVQYYIKLEQVKISLLKDHAMSKKEACEIINDMRNQAKERLLEAGGQAALRKLHEAEQAMAQNSTTHSMENMEGEMGSNAVHHDEGSTRPSSSSGKQDAEYSENFGIIEQLADTIATLLDGQIEAEQLIHEVILDSKLILYKNQWVSPLQVQVTNEAKRAFFDLLAEDMAANHPKLQIMTVLSSIRENLIGVLRTGSGDKSKVQEVMDITLMEQEIKQNAFDVAGMLDFVLQIIQRNCAPVRDNAVEELMHHNGPLIEKIQSVMDLLEDMSLDLANFYLSLLRKYVMPVATEYERWRFSKQYRPDHLVHLQQWCALSLQNLQEGTPDNNKRTSPRVMFNEALVSLLVSGTLYPSDEWPETLDKDYNRLVQFHNTAQTITLVAALTIIAHSCGTTDLDSLASKLLSLLRREFQDPKSPLTASHLAMELVRSSGDPDKKNLIESLVAKTASPEDPLYRMLSKRVGKILLHHMQHANVPETLIQSFGLSPVARELTQLCTEMSHFATYNYNVHAEWYAPLLESLQKENGEAVSSGI